MPSGDRRVRFSLSGFQRGAENFGRWRGFRMTMRDTMAIMSLPARRIGQRRRATRAPSRWLYSGEGSDTIRAFSFPAGSSHAINASSFLLFFGRESVSTHGKAGRTLFFWLVFARVHCPDATQRRKLTRGPRRAEGLCCLRFRTRGHADFGAAGRALGLFARVVPSLLGPRALV